MKKVKLKSLIFKSIPKYFSISIGAILIILIVLFILINTHGFQNWLAQMIAQYLSKELNTEIKLKTININIFKSLTIDELLIKDQHRDTLLFVDKLYLDFSDFSFKEKSTILNNITLKNGKIKIKKYDNDTVMNYQFLVNYFSTTTKDTTDTSSNNIFIRKILLDNINISYSILPQTFYDSAINFNNLDVNKLSLCIKDLIVTKNYLKLYIENLNFIEKSGLQLNKLKGNFELTQNYFRANGINIKTNNSSINFSTELKYNSFNDFSDFVDKVSFKTKIDSCLINSEDLSYFLPQFKEIKQKLNIKGEVYGKISDIKSKNLFIYVKNGFSLHGNIHISGLPNIDETFIHANITNLNTSLHHIDFLNFTTINKKSKQQISNLISKFGNVSFKGKFSGFIYDFVANGEFNTSLGKIITDIKLSTDDKNNITYSGELKTQNLLVGELLSTKKVFDNLTMGIKINGTGTDFNTVKLYAEGKIDNLIFNGYNYKNIILKGSLKNKNIDGKIIINDPNINILTEGYITLQNAIPKININSKITNTNLTILNIIKKDTIFGYDSELYADIKANFEGNNLDNIEGNVELNNFLFCLGGKYLKSKSLTFSTKGNINKRHISIKSDIADISMDGEIHFASMTNALKLILNNYFNNVIPDSSTIIDYHNNFHFNAVIKNVNPLISILAPKFAISPNTTIKGKINTYEGIILTELNSQQISYGNNHAMDIKSNITSNGKTLSFNFSSKYAIINDTDIIRNINLNGITLNDTTDLKINWESSIGLENSANIWLTLVTTNYPKITVNTNNSNITINDTTWYFSNNSSIIIDTNLISINNLRLNNKEQYLQMYGNISRNPNDILNIEFNNFNLESINIFTKKAEITFNGFLNGKIIAKNLLNAPIIYSEIKIDKFYFNNNLIGKVNINSGWNFIDKALMIQAFFNKGNDTVISIIGNYYPEKIKDNLDFDVNVKNLNYNIFSKWLNGFLTDFNQGKLSGKMRLEGELNDPNLNGKLLMRRVGFRVKYTNVYYVSNTVISFDRRSINFDNFEIQDSAGNVAIINGKITHNFFSDLYINLTINADKFSFLNTTRKHNNLYYGSAIISGKINISGPPDKIKIDIGPCITEKGTQFFLPLDGNTEVEENKIVHFVNKRDTSNLLIKRNQTQVDLSGIELNFDLQVTRDAEVQLILDEKVGDIIKARGYGDLKFMITPQGDFKIFNEYLIEEGDYLFTLQNVINKKFKIQKGSYIKWNGDPYDAEINIVAVYNLKASINDLGLASDTSKNKVPVACYIKMKNNLLSPDIKFEIDFPGMDEMTKERILSHIENNINMQILSLLVTRRFAKISGIFEQSSSTNNVVGNNVSELLSNQLSNWLSQISNKVDVGINYRAGDKLSKDELEFALSTQLFNERLTLHSNLDIMGAQQKNTSNIVGDVEIEYKVTEKGKLKIKAFNKSNDSYDLFNESRSKQGIGVFYRKEFDSFKEIFKKNKKQQ